jgi:hypothetical protein
VSSVLVAVVVVAAGCSGSSSSARSAAASSTTAATSGSSTSVAPGASSSYAVAAVREPLTTNRGSPVVHDNEVMALASHAGRLFAVTDQWEYSGPAAFGQVLVKNSTGGPWTVFEQTQSVRVQAIDSFPIPADQGLGSGHSLLVTQAIVNGRSVIQWLVDVAPSFSSVNSYVLSSQADVRSFGAHESAGVWSVSAGVNPTGVLRGVWSRAQRTLVFGPTPELTAAPPGSPGLKTQKVTGFADCGGALYVSINVKLFRRNDGSLPAGVPRWVLVYQAPPVGANNSGLRGISCISHSGAPSLLVSTEGNGDVFRFDHLPRGQLDTSASLVPVLEFSPVPRFAPCSQPTVPGCRPPAKARSSM